MSLHGMAIHWEGASKSPRPPLGGLAEGVLRLD